jgi:hypothetical protein
VGARVSHEERWLTARGRTPLYIVRATQIWVVPPIKAREQRISVCFPLHYPEFIDFQIYFILIHYL